MGVPPHVRLTYIEHAAALIERREEAAGRVRSFTIAAGLLNSNQGDTYLLPDGDSIMAVHRISLVGALLLILLALVLLFILGPFALIILILAVVLLWYAFGPGGRVVVTT
ncbi:MAG: hypothetical protein WAN74_07085 [Thermoplasmata archaeon]